MKAVEEMNVGIGEQVELTGGEQAMVCILVLSPTYIGIINVGVANN